MPSDDLANSRRRNSYGGTEVFFRNGGKNSHRYSALGHSHEQGHQLVEAMVEDLPGIQERIPNPKITAHSRSQTTPSYQGYLPDTSASINHKKLPIIVQFHGGGFVTGSKDSGANDTFCKRIAKLCDAIVIAVGYRLAPENKYPAAFDDGFEALIWLAKQANLAECSKSQGHAPQNFSGNRSDLHRELVDSFGGSDIVEPWLSAHGDPSR